MPRKTVASQSVDYIQVLDPEGVADEELDPDIDHDTLIEMYRYMVLSRETDMRMLKLQRQGRMGTFPPCTGHEAAACAAAMAMGDDDWLLTSYRELGARLIRGESLLQYLRYWNGLEEGNVSPEKHRVLPMTVIIAAGLPHAVGLAYASKVIYKEDAVVLAFFGDGATSEGDFHEAMNFAGVWKLPVIFFCVNNQWAISMPRKKQTSSETLAQKAIAYGFSGTQLDGNDPLAVFKLTSEAIARARKGEGPSLIEAITYRLMMHTTADDPRRYRDEEEDSRWAARDCLPRFRRYLEGKGIWNDEMECELAKEVSAAIEGSVAALENGPSLAPDNSFDHVFERPHPDLERQRASFMASLTETEVGGG